MGFDSSGVVLIMRIMRDGKHNVEGMEMFESEMCEQLQLSAEQIREWGQLFPPTGTAVHPERGQEEATFRLSREQMETWRQYAKILRTGMTVKQVQELHERDIKSKAEGKKTSFLEMYASLSDECPPGITAHAMRSYCTILLYQNRGGKMLLSRQLAQAAGIPEASALRHIKYLQATGLLALGRNDQGQPMWEFAFVPKALSRAYPD